MNRVGILATLQARPGGEIKVEEFLKSATPLVAAEVGTTAWFAFKVGPGTFGIFDTFNDEQGRNAHANGEVAKALFARAEELFVTAPQIQMIDIVGRTQFRRTVLILRALTRISGPAVATTGCPGCHMNARPLRLAIHPMNSFAYVTNMEGNSLSAFSLDNGALSPISAPVPTGQHPFGVAFDPTGSFLYVANKVDNTISAFSVDLMTTSGWPSIGGRCRGR